MPFISSLGVSSSRAFKVNDNAPIVQSGLVLNLDATSPSSYPGSGTTWYDLSPSGLHATGASPLSGYALQFNNPYTTATTSILNTDVHSLFFSIKLSGGFSSVWDKIFGYEPSGTDRSPGIWRYPSNNIIHWRFDPGNTDSDFTSTATGAYPAPGIEFSTSLWYYVGVCKNGATTSVYVNGVKLGDRTGLANPKTAGTSTIRLFPAYTVAAQMRHVHIYNRVLGDAEVLLNYNLIKNNL
jgi:hypothetical protein